MTFDVQHGLHDTRSVMEGIGAVALAGKPSLVRLPVGDNALASRVLDMGAEGVIAPMINTEAEAQALVAATKYPPVGERSWGPRRTMSLTGNDAQVHLETANARTFTFAMIETARALTALEDILAVSGIDGVFVGPSDLSVTLSTGSVAPFSSAIDAPVWTVAQKARRSRQDCRRQRRDRRRGRQLLFLRRLHLRRARQQRHRHDDMHGVRGMLKPFYQKVLRTSCAPFGAVSRRPSRSRAGCGRSCACRS